MNSFLYGRRFSDSVYLVSPKPNVSKYKKTLHEPPRKEEDIDVKNYTCMQKSQLNLGTKTEKLMNQNIVEIKPIVYRSCKRLN